MTTATRQQSISRRMGDVPPAFSGGTGDSEADFLYSPLLFSGVYNEAAETIRRRLLLGGILTLLVSAGVAILTKDYRWYGIPLDLGGVQTHLTIFTPTIIGSLLAFWFGVWWGIGPAFTGTLVVALANGIPLPSAIGLATATSLGLVMIALAYRSTPIPLDQRSIKSVVFFLFVSLFVALVGSSAAFVWAYTHQLQASETFRLWQGWWLRSFLQSVVITLPVMWAVGRPVMRWKNRLALHRPWTAPTTNDIGIVFGLMLFVLSMFILGASFLARLNLKTTLNGIRDQALVELITSASESLTLIDWVSFGFIIFTGYFGYQLALNWTQTLRRQMELQMRSLRESEERYRMLFEINPQPMYVYDRHTLEFLAVNKAMVESYGYAREELLGLTLREIRPPEDLEKLLDSIANAQTGMNIGGQWWHQKKDGTQFNVEIVYHLLDFDGRPAILAQATDVSDRKRTEDKIRKLNDYLESSVRERTAQLAAANVELLREVGDRRRAEDILRQTNQTLETLIQSSPLAIIMLDREGCVKVWNRAAERTFGWSEPELLGHPLPFGDDAGGDDFRTLQEVVLQGVSFSVMDFRTLKRDEVPIDISLSAAPVRDDAGKINGIMAVINDITDHKRAEEKLRESEERYRDLFENANDLIQSVAPDGRLLYVNRAWLVTLGYTEEEATGLTMLDIIDPGHQEHCIEALQSVMSGDEAGHIETIFVTRDGRRITVEGSINCKFENGRPVSTRGMFRDVTSRKQAEEELRHGEARIRAIIENSLSGLLLTDQRGFIQLANPSAERIFGYGKDELNGQHLATLLPDTVGQDKVAFLKSAREKALGRVTEWQCRRRTGEIFPVELSFYEFDTPEGHRFAGNVRDLSERHEVDRLKKEFISTVSHELRTPLTSIRGSLSLLTSGIFGALPTEAVEMLSVADRNTVRLIALINDILDLERLETGKMEMHFEMQPLAPVLHRAFESVSSFARQQSLSVNVLPTEAVVLADGDRLVQVLVNLLSNAVKFSPGGSEITISTSGQKGWVEVRVQDQGRGIPTKFLDKIFERFRQVEASDDRQKGGTGLGLAICRNIIEQHRGTIGVESEEGKGSTFWFRIPAVAAKATDHESSGAQPAELSPAENAVTISHDSVSS